MNKTKLKFELIDGIWPGEGTYIDCGIPQEWLNEVGLDALDWLDDGYYYDSVDLVPLIEKKLQQGVNEHVTPARSKAAATITALRNYADYLERNFIHGEHSHDDEHTSHEHGGREV